jgi:hypothetical protein
MKVLSFLILLACFSCMTAKTTYEYADGSGNVYVVKDLSVEYKPVTPRNSSSGVYSGGEPAHATVSSSQYDSLVNLLESAMANSSIHQENREMMTGLIVRYSNADPTRTVLKRDSSEKNAIETALKKLLGR